MAQEGGEQALLAMIGADPKQLAEAGELDSPRNSTGSEDVVDDDEDDDDDYGEDHDPKQHAEARSGQS